MSSKSASASAQSVPVTKRPARTIDLEAEDVTAHDAAKEEESRAGGSARDEAQDESDADKSAPGVDESSPGLASARSGPPPAQRTKPADIKSFVTHLSAGLAGGLIGVIGAGIALDRIAVPGGTGQLAERVGALETKLAALPEPEKVAQVREASRELETRLAALEKKEPGDAPEIKDMTARLGKLEATLKTLRQSGAGEGAAGVARSAALETRVNELKADMAALALSLETRAASSAENSRGLASGLAERIGSFEQKIALLEKKLAEASASPASVPAPAGDGAALALAFESLRRAAERGRPYADHLNALKGLAPDGLDLSPLEANAASGVATKAELLTSLPGVLKAARGAIAASGDVTFLDRVVSNARSVVRIRRIGPAEGDSPGAVLSRMEAQMKVSSLRGVLREAKGLSGTVLDAVQPWIDRAMARRASEDQLDALGQQLLSGLQSNADGKR